MTLQPDYFDQLYGESPDPWGFRDRWYERRKRALTLAMLPDQSYDRIVEPGCSIGVLTRELATRCTQLIATDLAEAAVLAARERCADQPHVQVLRAASPTELPPGLCDLMVLSEVVYYLEREDAEALASKAIAAAQTVVAVHWRHPVVDYPLSGDQVHDLLDDEAYRQGLTCLSQVVEPDLVAAVWSRDPRSVAARTGLR